MTKSKWYLEYSKSRDSYLIRMNLVRPKKKNLKLSDVDKIDPDLYLVYQQLRAQKNKEALANFVEDLNKDAIHEDVCRKKWLEKLSKLENRDIFSEFFEALKVHHRESYAKDIYGAFNKYAKSYFFDEKKLKLHEWKIYNAEFVDFIYQKHPHVVRGKEVIGFLSLTRIKVILSTCNYFYNFLLNKEKDPRFNFEFKNTKSLFQKKNHQYDRKEALPDDLLQRSSREFIIESDLLVIKNRVPDQIKAHFYLALNFGLREGETLGLVVEHVKVSFLSVERQLTKLKDGVPKYAPTKNRKKRKTPYYFSSPEECYDNVLKMQIMVPRTLGKLWKDFQDHLFNKKLISKRYEFHSIRNTYITSLIILMDNKKLEISITDIQLAVGHSSRQQTEAYLRDYRDLQGSQTFVPKKVA